MLPPRLPQGSALAADNRQPRHSYIRSGQIPTCFRLCHPLAPGAATLVDTIGTAALISVSPKGGMSLTININYLAKAEGEVVVDAQVRSYSHAVPYVMGSC